MINLEEKKDHLIVKHKDFNSLPQEKQEWLINYFKSRDNPSNMTIDWLKLNNYDIEDIYKATLEKSKTALKKSVKKSGVSGLREGRDYIEFPFFGRNIEAYIPLHWEASKLMASKTVGGCEGKWCTAYQKTDEYWIDHCISKQEVLIYVFYKNTKFAIICKCYVYNCGIEISDSENNTVEPEDIQKLLPLTFREIEYIVNDHKNVILHAKTIINKNQFSIFKNKYLLGKEPVPDSIKLRSIILSLEWGEEDLTMDLNELDVSEIEDFGFIFSYSDFRGDISKWDVSKGKKFEYMFYTSSFDGDISNWDVHNAVNMSYMFFKSNFNGDISKWDVSNVKYMNYMFGDNTVFNSDISKWDVSNVVSMTGMFKNSIFNQDISRWNVSRVRNMNEMFYNSKFNRDISNWDVSNVENMNRMFYKAKFSGDISKWNVANVQDANFIFYESPLEQKYPNGLEDLIKEQQRQKENVIKKFLNQSIWKDL